MTGTNGLSAGDVLALTKNNDGIFGDGIWGIIMLLIVAGLFTGNGFGFGNNSGLTEEYIANQFTQRDLYNNNTNILDSKYALGTQVLENRYNCSQNASATQKEVLQNRYDNALQTQTLSALINQCCCENRYEALQNTNALLTQMSNNTNAILNKMCDNEITTLRDKLADRDRDLQTAYNQISQVTQTSSIVNQLRPYPVPAYQTASPYVGYGLYGYGCGCTNSNVI